MDQTNSQPTVHIVGAGISGLIAAIVLERQGVSPIILEATSQVGGRVKTDVLEEYQLDHGFQVLLDAYPKAKEYLDYQELALQRLSPGAVIFNRGSSHTIGDPLRSWGLLFPTLFAPVGTLGDKLKILKLNKQLKKKSLQEIFELPEKTTRQYLIDFGFSEKVISQFFRPFFSGIYLEPNLSTSSRMFEFVYKMFGEGLAVIPKGGIQAIANQLHSQLKKTTIRFDEPVKEVSQKKLTLASGDTIATDFTIVTTNPEQLIPTYTSSLTWKRCDNLYFTAPKRMIKDAMIGLSAAEGSLVNNIFYPTSIATAVKGSDELLSVTIVREHQLDGEALIGEVQNELKEIFGIENTSFIKRFKIPHALPDLNDLQYQRDPSESLVNERVAIAGDQLLNGSLNAAMAAGESAALAALGALEK